MFIAFVNEKTVSSFMKNLSTFFNMLQNYVNSNCHDNVLWEILGHAGSNKKRKSLQTAWY